MIFVVATLLITAALLPQTTPPADTSQKSAKSEQSSAPASPAWQAGRDQIAGLSGAVLKVTTKMVLIDVVVTGRDGKPVAGLKPEDFEVLEDGSKQEIKAFGASIPPKPDAPLPKHRALPPGVFTNTIDFHPEEGAPIILLLDLLNTPFEDQVYGKAQLLEYLKKNAGRHNIAIYVLGHRLELLQDFTNDPEVLEQVVSAMATRRLPAEHGDGEQMSIGPASRTSAPSNDPAALLALVKQQLADDQQMITTADRNQAIAMTLEAFRIIARHAGGLPGRKELIWLSSGFPLNFDVAVNTPFVGVLEETTNLLTDAEVSVYPVDISGLVAFDPNSFASGMAHLRATHAGMYQVASRTGGVALYERNDVDHAIEVAAEDGSTYYVLGYYPKNKNWNGEFRTIHVKVLTSGLQVRSRKGYFAVNPEKITKSRSEAAHADFLRAVVEDTGTSGMLPLFAQVIPPDKQHSQLFVDISVDPRSIVFTAQANGYQRSDLRFVTVVLDEKGKQVSSKSDTLNANLSPAVFAQVMQTSLALRQKLDLPPGRYRLRVGVCDLKSNLIGTLTAHAEITPQKP